MISISFDNEFRTPLLPDDAAWLVFDIETIRDPEFPPKKLVPLNKPGEVVIKDFARYPTPHRVFGSTLDLELIPEFPSPAECQVVSIATIVLSATGEFLAYYVFGSGRGEERKLWEFATLIASSKSISLCSWNGRRFDAPVINARLMKYGRTSPLYDHDYRYRYARLGPGMHLDLCDQLSDFGSARMDKLDTFCRLIGLPGKVFGDGGDVDKMYAAGEHEKIDAYCLTDVIQTAFLLQRHMLLRGQITRDEYRRDVVSNYKKAARFMPFFVPAPGGLFLDSPASAPRIGIESK